MLGYSLFYWLVARDPALHHLWHVPSHPPFLSSSSEILSTEEGRIYNNISKVQFDESNMQPTVYMKAIQFEDLQMFFFVYCSLSPSSFTGNASPWGLMEQNCCCR